MDFEEVFFLNKLQEKLEDGKLNEENWKELNDLLNCYIRSAARSNLQNWTKYNSEDSLFKFCSSFENHKYLKENFTKEEAKDLFVFVANNNYDLFKEFYETRQIKLKGGSFQYD